MAKEKPGAKRWFKSIFPKRDNRLNEWSPMPSGGIIAAFAAPVSFIFLVGAAFDADDGMSPLYGALTVITGLIVVWAMSDAAYIAGMRRIANQDIRDGFKSEKPSKTSVYQEFPDEDQA
jgi:energy-converting hydrogenase Eha subunit B